MPCVTCRSLPVRIREDLHAGEKRGEDRQGIRGWSRPRSLRPADVCNGSRRQGWCGSPHVVSLAEQGADRSVGAGPVRAADLDDVDIASLGSTGTGKGSLVTTAVTAERSVTTITLRPWRIRAGGAPVPTGSIVELAGKHAQVLTLGPARFLTAVIAPSSEVRLTTWSIGKAGTITMLDDEFESKAFDIAVAPSRIRPSGFIAATSFNNDTGVTAWAVLSSGHITRHSSLSPLPGRNNPSSRGSRMAISRSRGRSQRRRDRRLPSRSRPG